MLQHLLLLLALAALARSACLQVTWENVCDRKTRRCIIIPSVCPPQNSIMQALRAGSMSRIGDAGYVVEVWPYGGCEYDSESLSTFAACKDKAATAMEMIATTFAAAGEDAVWEDFIEPSTVQDWSVAEVIASNLIIQGYNNTVRYRVSLSAPTIEANTVSGGPGMLCRLFWFTGHNITIRNAVLDTRQCCTYFVRAETSVADCTPIVCTGKSCDNLHIEKTDFLGVGAAVRVQRDDRGMISAKNISIEYDRITSFDANSQAPPVSLVYVDASGTARVISAKGVKSTVYTKVGTYDTTIFTGRDVTLVNISDIVSASNALFVVEGGGGEYKHEAPKNVMEVGLILGGGALAGVFVLFAMMITIAACKRGDKDKHA